VHIQVDGVQNGNSIADELTKSGVDEVIIVTQPDDSAKIQDSLSRARFGGTIIVDPRVLRRGRQHFTGDIWVPVLGGMDAEFKQHYQEQFRRAPDYASAGAYDAAMLIVKAVRKVGLNRVRIREAVRDLAPYTGVTGTIQWDALGQNERAVLLRPIKSTGDERSRQVH
jgi:branched-chain amino acid transport system substrate-binding protein